MSSSSPSRLRIAYLADWDSSRESGVLKKMVAQVADWNERDHDAHLFLMSPTEDRWSGTQGAPTTIERGEKPIGRARAYRRLASRVEAWRPDVIYHRYYSYRSGLPALFDRFPTVFEINTDDETEYPLYLDPIRYRFHMATRARILKRARGIVCVTRELERKYRRWGAPTTVIANGITLNEAFTASPPAAAGLRLIFIGAPGGAWHGVDKILRLASRRPHWHFDLIGPSSNESLPNVTAHGSLSRDAYQHLLSQADIGIGTLALHRKHMDEASPLKVREYLAAGLPCIIGYEDTDFPTPARFLLQLRNSEDNVLEHLNEIDAFCEAWKGKRVERRDIRVIDNATKEAARLDFITSRL